MASTDSLVMGSESRYYKHKKGAWGDWLADELEADSNGWDLTEFQLKKGKSDDTINWADPCAWQKAKTMVPTSADTTAEPSATIAEVADFAHELEESDTETCSLAELSCDSEEDFCECDSDETDVEPMEEETHVERTRYQHKKGAWFDWLADELEADKNGVDLNELQLKKGNTDDTVNWADPHAWQQDAAFQTCPAEDSSQCVTLEVQNAISGVTVCVAEIGLCDTLDKLHIIVARELRCPCSYVQLLDGHRLLDPSQTLREAGLGSGSILNVLRRPCFLVTSSADHTAKLWDIITGECFKTLSGHTGEVYCAVSSPDNQFILTSSEDGTVRLWATETGECVLILHSGHGSVLSAAMDPDGEHIAAGTQSGAILVWSIASGECKFKVDEGDAMPVRKVAYSPDGHFILSANGTWDCGTAKVWDAETGESTAQLCSNEDIILDARYSPDGTSIVTGCGDDTAMVWDAESGELEAELEGHDGAVYATEFSHNGRRILTGSSDCTAKLWSAKSSQCMNTLKGHRGEVSSVSFSKDDALVATGSMDNTARIWTTKGGVCKVVMEGHAGPVLGVNFSRT